MSEEGGAYRFMICDHCFKRAKHFLVASKGYWRCCECEAKKKGDLQ